MEQQGYYFGRAHESSWISTDLEFFTHCFEPNILLKAKTNSPNQRILTEKYQFSHISTFRAVAMLFKVMLTLLKWPRRTQTFFKCLNPKPFLVLRLNAPVQWDSFKPNPIQAKSEDEVPAKSPPQVWESPYQYKAESLHLLKYFVESQSTRDSWLFWHTLKMEVFF